MSIVVPQLQKFLAKIDQMKSDGEEVEDEFCCVRCDEMQDNSAGRVTKCLHVYCGGCLKLMRQNLNDGEVLKCVREGCDASIAQGSIVTFGTSSTVQRYLDDLSEE